MFTVGKANRDFGDFLVNSVTSVAVKPVVVLVVCFIAIITFIKYEFAKNFQKNLIAYPNVQAALKSAIIKFDKLGWTMYVFDCVYFTTTKYM